jgi:hypothetical protein
VSRAEIDIGVTAFALGKLADLLHEGMRFPEIAESKYALDAAGIIAQLPIRSLRLEAFRPETLSAETETQPQSPPIAGFLAVSGKSSGSKDCVVGLGGLEPQTRPL